MSHNQPAPEGKDPILWEIAQKRASFKSHVVSYLIVNVFLWGIWFFSSGHHHWDMVDLDVIDGGNFPWPIWPTLGWGIGLAFHFAGAYIFPHANSVESEYEKLKNKK